MKAVILAAGIGNRLSLVRDAKIPKCLIEIGGKTLLERQLETLKACGFSVKDILIVIGGKGEVWREENKKKVLELHDRVLVNEYNIEKNQSYSLWLAIKDLEEDVLILDGDLMFGHEIVESIASNGFKSAILTRKGRPGWGNRVVINGNRAVGISPKFDSEIVYIGMAKFHDEVVKSLKKEIETGVHDQEALPSPLHNICSKHEIYCVDSDDIVNINTSADYDSAKERFG